MGYPTPLRAIHRSLNHKTSLASTSFSRGNTLEFGNRMAIVTLPNKKLLVWSAIPLGDEFQKALNAATNDEPSNYEVSVAIVPDIEHTLAAIDLKKTFPNVFVIGPSGITDKPDLKLDYEFKDEEANVVVDGSSITPVLQGFKFVFLNGHLNRELVMVDTETKTCFEADLLFNIPINGDNHEQYPYHIQTKGWQGYLTYNLNADCRIGRFLHRRLLKDTEDNKKGIKALLGLDFDTIVMSHGRVIEKDGKEVLKKAYSGLLQ